MSASRGSADELVGLRLRLAMTRSRHHRRQYLATRIDLRILWAIPWWAKGPLAVPNRSVLALEQGRKPNVVHSCSSRLKENTYSVLLIPAEIGGGDTTADPWQAKGAKRAFETRSDVAKGVR